LSKRKSMENKIRSFRDLRVWQKGIELVGEIYRITEKFPKEETYGLSSQMRRAAVSVPSNIAEGFRRKHVKEHKQFLNISLGSCAELETLIVISKNLKHVDADQERALCEMLNHICGMIVNLDKKL
jgi:four helix bundle protein